MARGGSSNPSKGDTRGRFQKTPSVLHTILSRALTPHGLGFIEMKTWVLKGPPPAAPYINAERKNETSKLLHLVELHTRNFSCVIHCTRCSREHGNRGEVKRGSRRSTRSRNADFFLNTGMGGGKENTLNVAWCGQDDKRAQHAEYRSPMSHTQGTAFVLISLSLGFFFGKEITLAKNLANL